MLARQDRADHFLIPEKLYGRENEVKLLLAACERTLRGPAELALVAGPAGIGKTAMIHEVQKTIAEKRGFFIKGRFEQFRQSTRYSAYIEALRDLMGQLLAEDAAQREKWKSRILTALGESGQVVVDVIPELEKIIGPQPGAPEISGIAAENRFNLLFQRFLGALATPEHPLVIFLDDLQWADPPSLELTHQLITQDNPSSLLLLSAYSESEAPKPHSLGRMIEEAGKRFSIIHLEPLETGHIGQLVADALGCSPEMATPLAELLFRIAKGNPFFNNQLLKSLHDEGLIAFDPNAGYWSCDISQVARLSLADDVVKFLASQLQKLPDSTQEVLRLAACFGHSFTLSNLAKVVQLSPFETAGRLWPALQDGIIFPLSEAAELIAGRGSEADIAATMESADYVYKFLHERMQLAAYSLIPPEQTEATHLLIGRLLLKDSAEKESGERIFEIVDHYSQGIELVRDPVERQAMAELSVKAGQKAKAAFSYRAAYDYFSFARGLLAEDSWISRYDFILDLYESSVEAAYLIGEYSIVEELAQIVRKNSRSLPDQSRIYELRIQALAAQNKIGESIDVALEILTLMGVGFPESPTESDIETAFRETQAAYQGKGIENLIDLPLMTDPHQLAVMGILANISAITFGPSAGLYSLALLKMAAISIAYGNTPASALGYALYGYFLCHNLKDIESGYRFARLGLDLVQKLNAKEWHSRVCSNVHFLVSHWKMPLRNIADPLQSSHIVGLETGDFQSAAFSRFSRTAMSIVTVDMEKMARMVFLELTTEEQRKRIDFRIGKLLPAGGDPTLLHQTWLNLISNAIKFSAARDRIVIGIDSMPDSTEIVYSVMDNGAGFDMRYADKLFGVFQRLHAESEFEGTGVGLAIVQRIIHRHNGRVWAEGEAGKGATFYFSLPHTEE